MVGFKMHTLVYNGLTTFDNFYYPSLSLTRPDLYSSLSLPLLPWPSIYAKRHTPICYSLTYFLFNIQSASLSYNSRFLFFNFSIFNFWVFIVEIDEYGRDKNVGGGVVKGGRTEELR